MIVSCLNRKESLGPRDSMQESHAMVSHVTSTLDPNFHSMVRIGSKENEVSNAHVAL